MTQITEMTPSFCLDYLSQPGLFLRTADIASPTRGRLVSSEFSRFLGPVERGRKFSSVGGEDLTQERQLLPSGTRKERKGPKWKWEGHVGAGGC